MNFTLIRAEYDRETQRAYVELRARDDEGGDRMTVAIFSYRTTSRLSKQGGRSNPRRAYGYEKELRQPGIR